MRGKRPGDERDNHWLLIKHRDEFATDEEDIRDQDRSVLSGRTLDEIQEMESRSGGVQWQSNRSAKPGRTGEKRADSRPEGQPRKAKLLSHKERD